MPLIFPGRLELRYEDIRQRKAEGRDIREKLRRDQIENNEFKRRELATKQYNLLRGEARIKAMAEEKRKTQEYEIQQRHLFPPPSAESKRAATRDETTKIGEERQRTKDTASTVKGKGKERMDLNANSPASPAAALSDPDAILPVTSTSSTVGPTATSGRPSPPSSTSTPPSLTGKTIPRVGGTKTAQAYQISPMTGEKYRLSSISSYFLVDRFCPAYATPAPNLKRVMELGVLHLASGGTMKGASTYHEDCCPNWPMPTTS